MTDFIQAFITYLKSLPQPAASATLKNYVADIRQFARWFEQQTQTPFQPQSVTSQMIDHYLAFRHDHDDLSILSLKRHIASIRKFFLFLQGQGYIATNPFSQNTDKEKTNEHDVWHKKQFKDHLQLQGLSKNTVTNYLIDLGQFFPWFEAVTGVKEAWDVAEKNPLKHISSFILEEYLNRLLKSGMAAVSVNRKLSALRKYTAWLYQEGYIGKAVSTKDASVVIPSALPTLTTPTVLQPRAYASFAPLRLLQKTVDALDRTFEIAIVTPTAELFDAAEYVLWLLCGKPTQKTVASQQRANTALKSPFTDFTVGNVQKSVYAPLAISLKSAAIHKKVLFHLRHTRPKWYKRYHDYPVVHYFHFAVLIICMTVMGISFYQTFFVAPQSVTKAQAAPKAPSRLLSFQGKITDPADNPIVGTKNIRFSLYNSLSASGSAMLWEELQNVTTDRNGVFAVELGKKTSISQTVFGDNPDVYLGITVGNDQELKPRQQLATVAYATNAELLQGLAPITQTGAGNKNVVLALDSTGNLAIGGSADTKFEATGGELKLSGKSLVLATNVGTGGDVTFSPDGIGLINTLRPIHNSSNNNNLAAVAGAVEIDDMLAVYATSSAQSAFVVEQSGTGPIISASTSGFAKFTVQNDGTGYFAGKLGIGVSSPSAKLTVDGASIGKALVILNESGNQHILVGSASGTLKFYFDRSGNLTTANGALWKPTSDSNAALRIGNSSGTSFVTFDSSNARVGIGTTPNFKLDITDSQSATVSAMITNSSTDADADVLALKLGITTDPATTNRFITFLNGNGTIVGKVQGNGASGVSYTTTGVDFAEYFKKQDQTEIFAPGELVCIGNAGVTKCTSETHAIVGVVSNQAGFVGGADHEGDLNFVLVGLTGQLRVRIDKSGEAINVGDPLTAGNIPSVAKKAATAGPIVGRALESFNPSLDNKDTILISVSPSWYDPQVYLTDTGNLSIVKEQSATNGSERFSVQTLLGHVVTNIGSFSKAVVGVLTAGAITATDITTQTLTVTSDKVTISGMSLQNYIKTTISESQLTFQGQEIISPIAAIDRVQTNIISPLSSEKLTIRLPASESAALVVENASNSAVAVIDHAGNARFAGDIDARRASFSGQLTSDTLSVNNNASISGVLRAQKIIANEIEFPVAAQKASPAEDIATPSQSATVSAALAALGQTLTTDFGTFRQGLTAFGPVSLGTTAISGQLSVGSPAGGLILADNAINVLGASLELQPLRQGSVVFVGGLVEIDIDGNLRVNGNATFGKDVTVKGSVLANIIAPIPSQELVIRLGTNDSNTASSSGKLIVKNASDSAVLGIDQQGNLTSSGAANFRDVFAQTFSIIRSAQADTSMTETIATSSAGTATILPGEKERTIYTPYIKEDSLVYITPTSDTQGQSLYVARQTTQDPTNQTKGSFTITVQKRVSQIVSLNWWIVN